MMIMIDWLLWLLIDEDDDDDDDNDGDSCREWCPSFTRTILERSAVVVVVCRCRRRHRYVAVDSFQQGGMTSTRWSRVEKVVN